ncbi:MAG TPA: cytochrome c biogenesis protein ResB [Myxococcales bacterium]|jgi:hypothetical protein
MTWKTLRRWLRAPRLIIAELGLVSLAAALMAAIPQAPDPADRRAEPSALGAAASALGLDHVLGSWWFLALLALSAASLWIVTWDQWKSARSVWREKPTPDSFREAPFRRQWTRPPTEPSAGARSTIETTGRLSLLGSPLFHAGLLMIIAAGVVRMLFGAEAVVDLYEDEVLPPLPAAFGAQWPGRLAQPFALDRPLRLERLSAETYPSGGLKLLSAEMRFEGEPRAQRVAVNAPLRQGLTAFYLSQSLGPAALVRVDGPSGHEPVAVLLQPEAASGSFSATTTVGDLEVRLRGEWRPGTPVPERLQCRVLRDRSLVFAGLIGSGMPVKVPGGGDTLTLVGARQWARFTAQRDPSTPLIYLGFVVCLMGTALMFGLVKVDTAVLVQPGPEGETVVVALRARRFSALFEERFEHLVRKMGGPEKPPP